MLTGAMKAIGENETGDGMRAKNLERAMSRLQKCIDSTRSPSEKEWYKMKLKEAEDISTKNNSHDPSEGSRTTGEPEGNDQETSQEKVTSERNPSEDGRK